ncbi:MAG: ATP synthase subunit I [Alphaproteobacteria bacterium]
MDAIRLSYPAILTAFLMGGILSILYLGLLWYSLKLLPKVKKRGLFLFASAALRLFLFLFLAVYLAKDNVGRFLWIIVGFITVRLILLSRIKNKRKNK